MANSTTLVSVVAVLSVAAIALGGLAYMRSVPVPLEPAKDRLIWIDAMEVKGSTEAAKLAPPESNPADVGDAFGFKWVEPNKKWEVSAYMYNPATIVVNQGDRVTLRIFGINGDEHKIYLDDYAPNEQKLNRGRFLDISFTADKAGIFELVCSNHDPAMKGTIVVQPRVG